MSGVYLLFGCALHDQFLGLGAIHEKAVALAPEGQASPFLIVVGDLGLMLC